MITVQKTMCEDLVNKYLLVQCFTVQTKRKKTLKELLNITHDKCC